MSQEDYADGRATQADGTQPYAERRLSERCFGVVTFQAMDSSGMTNTAGILLSPSGERITPCES